MKTLEINEYFFCVVKRLLLVLLFIYASLSYAECNTSTFHLTPIGFSLHDNKVHAEFSPSTSLPLFTCDASYTSCYFKLTIFRNGGFDLDPIDVVFPRIQAGDSYIPPSVVSLELPADVAGTSVKFVYYMRAEAPNTFVVENCASEYININTLQSCSLRAPTDVYLNPTPTQKQDFDLPVNLPLKFVCLSGFNYDSNRPSIHITYSGLGDTKLSGSDVSGGIGRYDIPADSNFSDVILPFSLRIPANTIGEKIYQVNISISFD